MFNSKNTTKLLIGKDIARSSPIQITDKDAANYIADGEILILNETGGIMTAATDTVADSASITIIQGRGGANGFKFSNKIDGDKVIRATAVSYSAPAEQVTYVGYDAVATSGSIDAQAFTDYKLTIVYTHDTDLYAQQTNSRVFYYTTGAAPTQQEIAEAFRDMINAEDFYNAVAATVNSGANYGIRLTGQALDFTVGQEKYNKMRFEVLLSGFGATTAPNTQTDADLGSGTYEQIAELEWFCNGFDGVINRVHFPAPTGTTDAVAAETYDIIAIEHYLADDNYAVSGQKPARALTMIAIPDNAGGNQMDTGGEDVLTILNSWLASASLPFSGLTV